MDLNDQSKLSHLTDAQINELIDMYYNSDLTVTEVMELFDIKDVKPTELYKLFPPIVSEELLCKYCNIPLIKNRKSKSSYSWESNDYYCSECGHIYNKQCNCENCRREYRIEQEREIERKRKYLIEKINFDNYKPAKIDDLTITQKVYLGSLLRSGISDNYEYINPINDFTRKLTPTEEYDEHIFDELFFNNIIRIHPKSSVNDFTIDYKKDTFTFFWKKIFIKVNIIGNKPYDDLITELLNPTLNRDASSEKSINLWKEIVYWECIELFRYRMNAYSFEYNIGKDTKGFIESTIEKIPISQIYSIIWNAAKNSAAYYQEGNVPKNQAANSTLSRMRNSLDKILSGQWNKYDYSRPKDCPQSIISEYYFNSIIKICDQGWYRIPAIIQVTDENKSFNDEETNDEENGI